MSAMKRLGLLLLLLLGSSLGCATLAGSPGSDRPAAESAAPADDDRPSTLSRVVLYIPNRVLDLFDIVRFGINVGPGIGVDAQVTDPVRAGIMSRTSAGVGFQGLRHLPVMAAVESYAAVGPLEADCALGPRWYRSGGDVRIEPHLLLVGAHVAVDTFSIGDFIAGIFGFDPSGDDLGF